MAEKLSLDVRELFCPEPVEVILERVDALEPGQYLEVFHHREPVMLYPLLAKRGFASHCHATGSDFRLWIWRMADIEAETAVKSEFQEQDS